MICATRRSPYFCRTYSSTSPRRASQKSTSISGGEMRSGFRKRSKINPYWSGSMSVMPSTYATSEPAAAPRPGSTGMQRSLATWMKSQTISMWLMNPVFVLHHLPRADAKHHVVCVVVAPSQEMDIVCGDQADAEVLGDFWQNAIALPLLFHPMVMHLHEEIFRSKDVAILSRALFGNVDLVRLNRGVHFAGQTTAEPNQSRRMLCQKFFIDPRPVMKSIEMRSRDQFNQIVITGFVACEQCEVIRRLAHRVRPIFVRAWRDVGFAADDRLDPGALCFLIKFDRTVKVAVIGHRDRGHFEFGRFLHQLFYSNSAVEQGIFGVEMEVNERIARHSHSL